MNKDTLIKKGFIEKPHPLLTCVFVLDVGRNRYVKIASFKTPNEIVFLVDTDPETNKESLIVVNNFDYDGYLTELKLNLILCLFV